MKSFRRIKKFRDKEYVYEITPYYDKTRKQIRQRSKYLGIYTGELESPVKRKDLSQPKSVLSYGEFIPFLAVIEELRLKQILSECVGKKTNIILSVALNKTVNPLSLVNIKSWYEGTILVNELPNAALSSQNLSKVLSAIGDENIHYEFSKRFLQSHSPNQTLLYDITSFSSYSKLLDLLEYGHNRDKDGLPQFNMSLIVDRTSGLPIFYDIYPGSISDVVTLNKTLMKLKSIGIKEPLMVLDRGFFSQDNIINMFENNTNFVIGATIQLKEMKTLYKDNCELIDNPRYLQKFNDKIMFVKDILFTFSKKTGNAKVKKYNSKGFFFYDPKRADNEKLTLYSILHSIKDTLDSKKFRDTSQLKSTAGKFAKYFLLTNKTVHFNEVEIAKKIKRLGKFIILANTELEWYEVLSYYKSKDLAEKGFHILKNYFGSLPSKVQTESVLKGLVFVFFISLILEMKLFNRMKETGLINKYSMQGLLTELHKLKKIKLADKNLINTEITKKQRIILEELDLCAYI